MTEDQQFAKIMVAIQAANAAGQVVLPGCYGVEIRGTARETLRFAFSGSRCCPLGAVIAGQSADYADFAQDVAAHALGEDRSWAMGFMEMFDSGRLRGGLNEEKRRGGRMGARVRRDLGTDRPAAGEITE